MENKPTLVICDTDERYVSSLAEYINSRQYLPLLAEPFTDPVQAEAYLQKGNALLLASETYLEKFRGQTCFRILLADKEPEEELPYPWVRKYQSADRLIRQIMDLYAQGDVQKGDQAADERQVGRLEDGQLERMQGDTAQHENMQAAGSAEKVRDGVQERVEERMHSEPCSGGRQYGRSASSVNIRSHETFREGNPGRVREQQISSQKAHTPEEIGANVQLLAVYSPVGRCGKTSFAITLGEQLARGERVLYLNLEDHSGFDTLLGTTQDGDLCDLLYFARVPGGSLLYKTNALVRTWDKLEYIPPAFSCTDLRTISAAEWRSFISRLAMEGDYDCIVLDVGTQIQDVFELLSLCERVYVPILEDPVSKGKLSQFAGNVDAIGGTALREKVRYLQLPAPGKETVMGKMTFPASVTRGKMGDYVRRMLKSR